MERYCLLHNWKLDDFQRQDRDECIDVNYRCLIEQAKKSENETNKECWDYRIHEEIKSYLEKLDIFISDKLIGSHECELDITEEIMLILDELKGDEEPLFQLGDNTNTLQEFEKNIDNMKNTVENIRDGKGKTEKIFDLHEINSTSAKKKIKSFGSGIVRLWLISKEFRNLFTYTVSRNEKYKFDNIIKIVDSVQNYGIILKLHEYILLEKILGIHVWMNFSTCILPYISNEGRLSIKEETLNNLIKAIMKYEGNNVRCIIVQNIGNILKYIQAGFRNYSEDGLVEIITSILEKNVVCFNELYRKVTGQMLRRFASVYTVDTLLKRMIQKRRDLNKVVNSWLEYDQEAKNIIFNKYFKEIIRFYERSFLHDKFILKLCREECKNKCPIEKDKDILLVKVERQSREWGEKFKNEMKMLCDFYKGKNLGLYYLELCYSDKIMFRKMGREQGELGIICQKEIINANYMKYSKM